MNFKELFEGATPKLPGAIPGIKIMTPQQFVAKSAEGEEPEPKEVDEASRPHTMGGGIRPPSGGPTTQGYGIRPPSSSARIEPAADVSDWKAPHGDENQEFEMFKAGTKPAVIVRGNMIQNYNGLLNTRKYPWKEYTSQGQDNYIIGQPGEQDRVDKIHKLVSNASKRAENGDFSAYNNSNYHRWLGTLLGYPKDKVEQFIKHYFRDREDLAQQQVDVRESIKRTLKEFDAQAQLAPPELEKDNPVDIIFYGRVGEDWKAEDGWAALEEVLPREYPPGTEKSQYKVYEVAENGEAVVTNKPLSVANKLVKIFQTYGIKARIDGSSMNEATKLPAQARELKGQELEDYLERIRKQEKTKSDKYKMPYIHRSSVMGYYNEQGKKYDTDAIKAALKERPKKLLKQNEKMKHSNGELEQFFNIGFAALTGIALDENTNELIIVNTCPGAGSCKVDCFAMKGGKIQFQGPWLSDGRILTYLLNDPDGFFSQLDREIKKEEKAGDKGGYTVTIRWHDAGDFFSPEYADLAFKLARENPDVMFYAYTKMADVVLAEKPANFMINWSEGAHTSQEKKVKASDTDLEKTKNSRIVPTELFSDLLVTEKGPTGKKVLVKGPDGQWQIQPDKLGELKQRLASEYGLNPSSILSYSEWEQKTGGGEKQTPLQYNVIIAPGEPDLTARDPGVLSTLLLRH